jgi:proline iminopeptidase
MKYKLLIISTLCLFLANLLSCKHGDLSPNSAGLLVPKTVDLDTTLPSIKVNGTMLHAEAVGNSNDPMLLVLHGGPGGDYRYLLRCKEFAKHGFYVVFYDQRGTGLSQRQPVESYTGNIMETMYDDLEAVINHYRSSSSQKVFMFGHSWGGMLASAYIDARMPKIDGLIVGEPGGLIYQDVLDYLSRNGGKQGLLSESTSNATFLSQILSSKQNQQEFLDYQVINYMVSKPKTDEAPLIWRAGAVQYIKFLEFGNKQRPDWSKNLKNYKKKVLFIYSENNKAYGETHAKKVSSAYADVELVLLKESTHNFTSYQKGWDNFLPIALKYLNSMK